MLFFCKTLAPLDLSASLFTLLFLGLSTKVLRASSLELCLSEGLDYFVTFVGLVFFFLRVRVGYPPAGDTSVAD